MSHFDGNFEKDLKSIIKQAKDGKFYKIFTEHGFYDVNDEHNGLTAEQRESVDPALRDHYSRMADAIAEMINFILGGKEGMLTNTAQEIDNNLDTAVQMSNSQLDAINNGLKAAASTGVLAPLGTVSAGMEATKSLMGAVLGKSYYNVNILPQITFGLDGFGKLGDLGNILKPGQLRPNWNFLYDNEKVKSETFFVNDNGNLKIGANIDVTELNELQLKKIFGVVSADKDLNPIGDIKGGVSQQEFSIIRKASDNPTGNGIVISTGEDWEITDSEVKNFNLNEAQMRASFNQYAEMKLWNVIKNPSNWAHGHWGSLTHNAMPEYVKTAVTSFIWTNGMALERGKSDDAALISYLTTIGLFYLIGYQYPVKIFGFEGDENLGFIGDQIVSGDGVEDIVGDTTAEEGLPKNEKIAKRYFIWVADILSRLTYNALPVELANSLRMRRVAEANLIYSGTGLPVLPYGISIANLPFEHTIEGWKQRKTDTLFEKMAGSFFRYKNEGAPGGDPDLSQSISDAKLIYGPRALRADDAGFDIPISETEDYVKSLMDESGVDSIVISSTSRDKENQARIMFNNIQRGNDPGYRQPGASVLAVYFKEKEARNIPRDTPVTDPNDITEIKAAMVREIDKWGEINVSRHCASVEELRVFDLKSSTIKNKEGSFDPRVKTKFKNILEREVKEGRIDKFLHPGNSKDTAFHIEVPARAFTTSPNNALPDQLFSFNNINFLRGEESWIAPLSNDFLFVNQKTEEGED